MITARRVNYIPKDTCFPDISFITSRGRHNLMITVRHVNLIPKETDISFIASHRRHIVTGIM